MSAARGVLRTVKNYTKGYSPMQMKAREATSNDPTGPSFVLMNELAQATYNQGDFLGVMEIIDKRMNDKGKHWRHVFKALIVLDFLLHAGSPYVVEYAVDNLFIVKTLREFQHIDDSGYDQGANVRNKAKELTALLSDRSRLEDERKNRNWMQGRMGYGDSNMMGPGYNNTYASSSSRLPYESSSSGRVNRRNAHTRGGSLSTASNRYDSDDREMRKAIAESKRSTASKQIPRDYDEDAELKKAIEESAREAKQKQETDRKREEREAAAVQSFASASAAEVDLLGGFDDSLSTHTAGAGPSNINNIGMMSASTASFSQQQLHQQQSGTGSAANDLLGAFGTNQMDGMNNMGGMNSMNGMNNISGMNNMSGSMMSTNNNFDPFGLNAHGNSNNLNAFGAGASGMGMSASTGMMSSSFNTNMPAPMNNSTNMFDNSGDAFGSGGSQLISQKSMATTQIIDVAGTPNLFGQNSTMPASSSNLFDSNTGMQPGGNSADLLGGSSGFGNSSANNLSAGGFNGASGAFGSAFDGGMSAKTLPFGVNPNDPNSRLAEIARNSEKIDPFASLALGSTSSAGGPGGNPFALTPSGGGATASSQALTATPSFAGMSNTTPGSTAGMGGFGSSLVDLSPAALATSNTNSSLQSFGQVNRNPFASGGASSTGLGTNTGNQPSLNQLMSGAGASSNMLSMSSTSMYSQQQMQQTPSTAMGNNAGFGGLQSQPQQQQAMMFQQTQQHQHQQTQQQQQINPFAQTTVAPGMGNQTDFFGL